MLLSLINYWLSYSSLGLAVGDGSLIYSYLYDGEIGGLSCDTSTYSWYVVIPLHYFILLSLESLLSGSWWLIIYLGLRSLLLNDYWLRVLSLDVESLSKCCIKGDVVSNSLSFLLLFSRPSKIELWGSVYCT